MNSNPSSVEYDSLTSAVAKLPMELVVTPYPEQKDPDVMMGSCAVSTKPIIVYKERGGLYFEPVAKWRNTANGHEGYGVLELLSDISNRPMQGADLKQMCSELCKLAGMDEEKIKAPYDYRQEVAPQKKLTYTPKLAFSVEELECLGCTVRIDKDGLVKYGFDCNAAMEGGMPYFTPNMIHKEFKVYSISECTLPEVRRDGKMVSERIIATPFNPMFVCFADVDESAGCIMRPGMPQFKNIVFSQNVDFTTTKVARWLGGDAVFTRALYERSKDKKSARNTGYLAALKELERTEKWQRLKDIWEVKENGKQQLVTVAVAEYEAKADNIIFCHSMPDAISAYYHLNALAACYPNSLDFKDKKYHVCFNFGDVAFSSRQYGKAHNFAHRIYTLFPNDSASIREARMIGRKYREIYRAALPESFADIGGHCKRSRIFQHQVCSVRDFFLVFKMDNEQAYANDYDINKFFLKSLIAALPSSPLKHCAKKDKNGETTDDYWQVNAATLWEFMASEGYCRVITNKSSADKIGRFYHLDFPFFDELDRNSMVSATRQCLRNYARTIARPDSNDYEKICDTIAKSREINDKTIDGLPLQDIDYRASYNEKLDHFYYRNCALRITPDEIKPVPYSQLGFFINRSEVLPWDYHTPFQGNNVPFTVSENPEYQQKAKEIEQKKEMKKEDGTPMFTNEEIKAEQKKLDNWARIYRWKFDFKGISHNKWWPPLQVLRGFANVYWEQEMQLQYVGKRLGPDEIAVIDAHLANLLFCLARPLYRYHNDETYCAPYLMENNIQAGQKAQGGSGKSTFVNTFMGCCGYILNVDAKSINPTRDISFAFSELVPKHHRVVHLEDLREKQNMQLFYNYVSAGFAYQKKFVDSVTIEKEEAPGLVISSNYALNDMSDSTTRRFPLCGFSDRFCGENVLRGQMARSPSEVMKDFTSNPEYLSPASKNQIAYICAVGVQMIMRYHAKINIPTDEAVERTEERTYGNSFMMWQADFFAHMEEKHLFGLPLNSQDIFEEYLDEYVRPSKKHRDDYKPSNFFGDLEAFCKSHGMVMNPEQTRTSKGKEGLTAYRTYYFRWRCWKRICYFGGKDWENDSTATEKVVREVKGGQCVIFIFKADDPDIPKTFEELKARHFAFMDANKDPDPVLDEQGNVVSLTEEESERWKAYVDFKQGKRSSPGFSGTFPMGGTSYKPQSHLTDNEVKDIEDNRPF